MLPLQFVAVLAAGTGPGAAAAVVAQQQQQQQPHSPVSAAPPGTMFRPANSSVLDAAALEQFVVDRTRSAPPGSSGGGYNLSVLPGRYLVVGPDQPGGHGRCAAHLCLGFLAALPHKLCWVLPWFDYGRLPWFEYVKSKTGYFPN